MKTWTTGEIARALGATLSGDPAFRVSRLCEPQKGVGRDALALALSAGYVKALGESGVRAAIIPPGVDVAALGLKSAIILPPDACKKPRMALARATGIFASFPEGKQAVHPSAVVEAGAVIAPDATIGAFVYVASGAKIGARTRIASHCTIGERAEIGADCCLQSGVRIGDNVRVGARCRIACNAVIGADGFSYTREEDPAESPRKGDEAERGAGPNVRIASLGAVVIGEDVDIGAGSCIDRGTLRDTLVGNGAKIDNLVQIGHNCVIGRHCRICGTTGIAGSVCLGDYVVVGGGCHIADRARVGSWSLVAGGSGVAGKWPERSILFGTPALLRTQALEQLRAVRRLPRLLRTVDALKKALSPGTGNRQRSAHSPEAP